MSADSTADTGYRSGINLGEPVTDDDFARLLADMRPRLHRYCARMTGSAIDGEDVVQDTLIKAVAARQGGTVIADGEAWLYRIAHNASLDFLRARARGAADPLHDDIALAAEPDPDIARLSFRRFLDLPVLQRCAVVLKDVLGHSVEEVAGIAGCSPAAAKSALQRGREALRQRAAEGDAVPPRLSDIERRRLQTFTDAFVSGDFDGVRRMLADDIRVDLVNLRVLNGRDAASPYFTRYAELTHWRFAMGAADGRAAVLVFDARGDMTRPAHFVLPEWQDDRIVAITDFVFAPYVMESCAWMVV